MQNGFIESRLCFVVQIFSTGAKTQNVGDVKILLKTSISFYTSFPFCFVFLTIRVLFSPGITVLRPTFWKKCRLFSDDKKKKLRGLSTLYPNVGYLVAPPAIFSC